jgi:hypothetical protein
MEELYSGAYHTVRSLGLFKYNKIDYGNLLETIKISGSDLTTEPRA